MPTFKWKGEKLVIRVERPDKMAACEEELTLAGAVTLLSDLKAIVAQKEEMLLKEHTQASLDELADAKREQERAESDRRASAIWMAYQSNNLTNKHVGELFGVSGKRVVDIAKKYSKTLGSRANVRTGEPYERRLRAVGAIKHCHGYEWTNRAPYDEMPPPEMTREEARAALKKEVRQQILTSRKRGVDLSSRCVLTRTDLDGITHGFFDEDGYTWSKSALCEHYAGGERLSHFTLSDANTDKRPVTCETCLSLLEDWRGWAQQMT